MKCSLLAVVALLAASFPSTGSAQEDKSPDVPAEREAQRLAELEARLAEVRAKIAASRDELERLKAVEAALVKDIAAGGAEHVEVEAIASLEKLLEKLPANARPTRKDDDLERIRANEWLAKNVVGRRIKLKWEISSVAFRRTEGRESLTFDADLRIARQELVIGDMKYNVTLGGRSRSVGPGASFRAAGAGGMESILLSAIDDETAEKLRALKGASVEIEGKLWDAKLSLPGDVWLMLHVENPVVAGVKSGE